MSAELLLEIGVEEVPARFLPDAERTFWQALTDRLIEARLSYDKLDVYVTPRRLVAVVVDLADKQADQHVEKTGPAVGVAYDKDGKPTKAAIGFAKGQGIEVDELETIKTDKGEYIGVQKTIPGRPTVELLPDLLAETTMQLPWPKSMRWGDGDIRFVRPIHWVLALYGGQVLPMTLGDVAAGKFTRGHRFHAPGEIEVADYAGYEKALREAKVIVDAATRKAIIREQLNAFATKLQGRWIVDEELLTHVAGLVELPVPLLGHIPEKYLELPREVLLTPMREHQKYFGFENEDGQLLPAFCVVANIESSEPETVVKGNERVLIARLEDARYFYEHDRERKLDDFAAQLTGMLYHEKLGSYAEKVERVRLLANWLCAEIKTDCLDHVKRAAQIYKADLLSDMVGEFPELQGVMGMHYARYQDEGEEVAQAIVEHYQPRFADDALPQSPAGAVLSVADKMDSIVACFGVGLQPTGAGDPYALRRQALGVLRILAERQWSVSLPELITKALDGVEDKFKADRGELTTELLNFFRDRLFHYVRAQGVKAEIADAVLAVRFERVPQTLARLEAVAEFARREEFEPFAVAFKRAGNIVKDYDEPGPVDTELLSEAAELKLYYAVQSIKDQVGKLVELGDVLGALVVISGIRPDVDQFFDDVLVMHKDKNIRTNRLNLVSAVTALFSAIADFRRV